MNKLITGNVLVDKQFVHNVVLSHVNFVQSELDVVLLACPSFALVLGNVYSQWYLVKEVAAMAFQQQHLHLQE